MNEASNQPTKERLKKFSHLTLDKPLLHTTEDEIDFAKVALKNFILVANYKEQLAMVGKSGTKFEIPRFDGTNFALWKLKMHVVLVKDGCVVALLTKEDKPEDMTDKQFIEKDKMALANLQLDLEDNVLDVDSIVASLLTEEMRSKSTQSNPGNTMYARDRSTERNLGEKERLRSKSKSKKKLTKC
ncbi:hypothetical protein SCA6_017446 [Theobroma cacao]